MENETINNKKEVTVFCLLFIINVFLIRIANAQMVLGDAFMKGNNVEIGISGPGGFEGSNMLPPSGMHKRGSTSFFGFVANPQLNAWASYDGDFFTPGAPENGWGFEIGASGGITKSNNCYSSTNVIGSITSWAHTGTLTSTVWDGDDIISGLHFKISYFLGDNDLFYTTTVAVTNTSSATINNLYYYRNLDPDNNHALNGDYSTQNTIINQPSACMGCIARVSATQTLPWLSNFEFLAIDSGYVCGFGGFSNRDGSDMYNGIGYTQTVGSTIIADAAIYLAYKISSLPVSTTHTFNFASVFSPSAVASASIALQHMSIVGINEPNASETKISIYPNPSSETTTISISHNVILSKAVIHIFDVIGNEVKTLDIYEHEYVFKNANLSNGVYFYKIINNGKQISDGKLIIKKIN